MRKSNDFFVKVVKISAYFLEKPVILEKINKKKIIKRIKINKRTNKKRLLADFRPSRGVLKGGCKI